MATLSTHVLDLTSGRPAQGVAISLFDGEALLFAGETNADGRCPALAQAAPLANGAYRLEFSVAAYFRQVGTAVSDPPFLDVVPICFGIDHATGAHYHVPLLVSPYGFSTYRGS